MKRIVTLLLLAALLCCLMAPASAAVIDPIEPYFQKIISTYVDFSINESTGIANCYARCIAQDGVTIKIVGTLQQYTNGSWVYVTSWSTTGTGVVVLDKQYAVYSGYKYRFIARFYIYDANGSFVESDMLSRIYDYT